MERSDSSGLSQNEAVLPISGNGRGKGGLLKEKCKKDGTELRFPGSGAVATIGLPGKPAGETGSCLTPSGPPCPAWLLPGSPPWAMLAIGQKIRVLAASRVSNCTQETKITWLPPALQASFALRERPSIQMKTKKF